MISNSIGLSVVFIQKDLDDRVNRLQANFLAKGFVENSTWECIINGYENKKERALKDIFTITANNWNRKVLVCRKPGYKTSLSSENELETLMDHLNYSKFLTYALRGTVMIRGDFKVYIATVTKNRIPSRNIFFMVEFSAVKEYNVTLEQYKAIVNNFVELFMAESLLEEPNYCIENNYKAIQRHIADFGSGFNTFDEKQLGLLLLNFFGQ